MPLPALPPRFQPAYANGLLDRWQGKPNAGPELEQHDLEIALSYEMGWRDAGNVETQTED
jgi:hypothetical protein